VIESDPAGIHLCLLLTDCAPGAQENDGHKGNEEASAQAS
jgi:hypothetical protein